jgi:hypothetical protein
MPSLFFFLWKHPILISYLDSTLNFEVGTSFCQHLFYDPCHFFRKKAGLQGFINKIITPEPLGTNN